jgi:D-alanyl-D-alanine carboxypeptidase/D-alanyl-D-alanine-endopeptidase (penicillin-binding protein 4)
MQTHTSMVLVERVRFCGVNGCVRQSLVIEGDRMPERSRSTLTGWKVLLVSLFLASPITAAQAVGPASQDGGDWAKLLRFLQGASRQVGIQVVSLTDRRVVFEHQSHQRLVPASLLKLLTSYAALKQLGPYHHFTTEVWSRDSVRDGVLQGDIWVKGNGDPYLVPEKLYLLAQKIREQGIRRIDGGIGIDNDFFNPRVATLCLDGQCDRSYNPVIAATSLNFNTVTLYFLPAGRAGVAVVTDVFPHGDYALVDNQTGAAGAKPADPGIAVRSAGVTSDGRERYGVTGHLTTQADEDLEIRVNANDPVNLFGRSFKTMLSEMGVEVRGSAVASGAVPGDARKITEYTSPPLKDVLHGLNRFSNNFMAEMLLRVLGAEVKGPPGSAEKGSAVIGETLATLGVPAAELELEGGSGLSRRCRVTVHALCSVLVAAYQDPAIAPEFLASLATGGEEGTLRRRGERLSQPSLIRGKTGSLRDVVGFAGYVSNPAAGPLAVVVLLNDVHQPGEAKATIDRFLSELAETPGPRRQ